MTSARRVGRFALVWCGLGVLMLGACVAEQKTRPPRAPGDLRASFLTVAVEPLGDADLNGYPDTIPVTIYIWDERYPIPIWADGGITFELHSGDEVLASWQVPIEVVESARRRTQVGPAHLLTLDMRTAMADVRPASVATLSAVFAPSAPSEPASTVRPMAIRIGN